MENQFYGLPTRKLENRHLRLEFLAEAGPRLVRLSLSSSEDNLLVELPEEREDTPYGSFYLRGGHRLWHSPEAFPRSYIPDNSGLEVEEIPGGVRLNGPTEQATGIQKRMEIRLDDDRPAMGVEHQLTNTGIWPVELSPWAISQLPLGGTMILPQVMGPLDSAGLLPNRQLVLWPYTRWHDSRLELQDDLILIRAQALLPPVKIGYLNRAGWLGYLRAGTLLRKRFDPQVDRLFPDFGCNVESYCNNKFIELETIGPLVRLQPGETTAHREKWEIIPGLGDPKSVDEVRAALAQIPV
jgi:hypothetical protein